MAVPISSSWSGDRRRGFQFFTASKISISNGGDAPCLTRRIAVNTTVAATSDSRVRRRKKRSTTRSMSGSNSASSAR